MEHTAQFGPSTLLRACAFSAIGIVALLTAFDFLFAFETAGLMTILAAFALILKSERVPLRAEAPAGDSRELREGDPDAEIARTAFLTYAQWAALASIVFWALAAIVSLLSFATETMAEPEAPAGMTLGWERPAQATPLTPAEWRRLYARYQFVI